MGRDRAVVAATTASGTTPGGGSAHDQWHFVRAENGLCLGGPAPGVRLPHHLLASPGALVQRRHLGTDLAKAAGPTRCRAKTGMGASVSGRELFPGQKR